MSLSTVSTGSFILASDVNQLVNVLQQPSGGQEIGTYYLFSGTNASGWTVSAWCASLSRNATPVSVAIGTTIVSPTGVNTPSTTGLSANGFEVNCAGSGVSNTARVAGLSTIQY